MATSQQQRTQDPTSWGGGGKTFLNPSGRDEIPRIDVNVFCEAVYQACLDTGVDIALLQAYEALGAVRNLYLGLAIGAGTSVTVEALDDFSSAEVPLNRILEEFNRCTGGDEEENRVILTAMQSVLRRFFINFNITNKTAVHFEPFDGLHVSRAIDNEY